MFSKPQVLWGGLFAIFLVLLFVVIAILFRRKQQESEKDLQTSLVVNQWKTPTTASPKIVIITLETRPLVELVKFHNQSVEEYARYQGYEYRFRSSYPSSMPVYWHKIVWMLEILLAEPGVDYVLWLDSDTMIVDQRIPLTAVIDEDPAASIYIGLDGGPLFELLEKSTMNAGVFMVRNDAYGRGFLKKCLDLVVQNPLCQKDGRVVLNGRWAGECYEQGTMNRVLKSEEFREKTCIIRPPLVSNAPGDTRDHVRGSLIIHRWGNKDDCLDTFRWAKEESAVLPVVAGGEKAPSVCLLLTMYGEPSRAGMYSQVLQKWCNLTQLPIFVVDSCGASLFSGESNRYRHFQYKEGERNSSLAEKNSIRKALEHFHYDLTRYDLVCKITGKYWIPSLEETLKLVPQEADLVVQSRTETNGQNSEIFAIRPSLLPALCKAVEKEAGMERGLKKLTERVRVFRFPFLPLEQLVERGDKSKLGYL